MKVFWALVILVFASGACAAAEAASSDYADIIIVSVAPRNPKIQPIVMSVPAKESPKQAVSLKVSASDAKR